MKGHGCKGLPGSNLWKVEMKRVESGYKKRMEEEQDLTQQSNQEKEGKLKMF